MELQVHGYELTLRLAEAEQIEIEQIPRRSNSHKRIEALSDAAHPGLGEEGKYHSKKDEHPLPEDTMLTYALVGNQNCGKTTLFNQLTGSNQHVGISISNSCMVRYRFLYILVASTILIIAFGFDSSTKLRETFSSLLYGDIE